MTKIEIIPLEPKAVGYRDGRRLKLPGLDSWLATWLLLMAVALFGALIGAGLMWLASQ